MRARGTRKLELSESELSINARHTSINPNYGFGVGALRSVSIEQHIVVIRVR